MMMTGNLCGQLRDSLSSAESGINVRPLITISHYRTLNHLQPKFFPPFLDVLTGDYVLDIRCLKDFRSRGITYIFRMSNRSYVT